MISVGEARALVLVDAEPLSQEHVSLSRALGRVLARDVVASRAQPPFSASAMDGYAVRAADTPGDLHIIGETTAGSAGGSTLRTCEAMRIFTGAALPEGADTIVIQEEARRTGDVVTVPAVRVGRHVRARGADFQAGETLLRAGRKLDGVSLGLAASAGAGELIVAREPRVSILTAGDELVVPGEAPGPAQIFDSVSFGIAGLAQEWGAKTATAPPLGDDLFAMAERLSKALETTDVSVMIGGASVGDRDFARAAAEQIGAKIAFSKVALRPGKPTWFARLGAHRILGLPGNPASAFVCAHLFLRPLLRRLLGRIDPPNVTASARLSANMEANGERESYLRAVSSRDESGQEWVCAFDNQDSSFLRVFAEANALIMRSPNAPAANRGDTVSVLKI